MNMPKDTKGTAPEDVEGHWFRLGSDESQATEQRDSGCTDFDVFVLRITKQLFEDRFILHQTKRAKCERSRLGRRFAVNDR